MIRLRITALLACLALLSPTGASAAQRNWQQSTETETLLWLRDKGEGPSFTATFTVTGPDGKVLSATGTSGPNGAMTTKFPQSFGLSGPVAHGRYHWQAQVAGKVVAMDDFQR